MHTNLSINPFFIFRRPLPSNNSSRSRVAVTTTTNYNSNNKWSEWFSLLSFALFEIIKSFSFFSFVRSLFLSQSVFVNITPMSKRKEKKNEMLSRDAILLLNNSPSFNIIVKLWSVFQYHFNFFFFFFIQWFYGYILADEPFCRQIPITYRFRCCCCCYCFCCIISLV